MASRGAGRDFARRGFIDRFVFPDGELLEVGSVVTAIQRAGFEARHVESLREHYALDAAGVVGQPRSATGTPRSPTSGPAGPASGGSTSRRRAVNFEDGNTQIHQVLAVKADDGRSGMELRPAF